MVNDQADKLLSMKYFWALALLLGSCMAATQTDTQEKSDGATSEGDILQTIEGRVQVEGETASEWVPRTRVVVDGGQYYGFLKSNGEFEIHNVPPGTYLVEVVSPNHVFEPARVDISSKSGKIRARKVNLLKTSSVSYLPYPLKFKVEKQAEFFEIRETWNIMNTIKNPMIWLLVGPMLLMVVMPKLMKNMDPDSQKEMQESMNVFNQQQGSMPSLEEMFTNWFGGGSSATKTAAKKPKTVAKRPRR